jgi:hypothetical protein
MTVGQEKRTRNKSQISNKFQEPKFRNSKLRIHRLQSLKRNQNFLPDVALVQPI